MSASWPHGVPSDSYIERALNGQPIGTPDASVICDECHAAPSLPTADGDYSRTFLGYATARPGGDGWQVDRIYCPEHDDHRRVDVPTEGADEAAVELTVELIGFGPAPCQIIDADVLHRSPPAEGSAP